MEFILVLHGLMRHNMYLYFLEQVVSPCQANESVGASPSPYAES